MSPIPCGFFPNIAFAQTTLSCAPPAWLNAYGSSGTALFNWAAVTGASNYIVYYKLRSATNWTTVITGNVTTYTLTGLLSDSIYYAHVRGLNCPTFGAMTQPSEYVSFYTGNQPCGPVPSITSVSNLCNQITANLSGGTGTWNLHVQRISPPPFSWYSFVVSSPVVNLSILGTSSDIYLVSAQAVCGSSYSTPSNLEMVSNAGQPPWETTVSNINCFGFKVTWDNSSAPYLAYRLLTRPVGTSAWTTHYFGFDSTYTIASLSPNVTYEVAMRTMRCVGVQSPLSVIQTIYTDGPGCRTDEDYEVIDPDYNSLIVYPNPTSGILNVAIENYDDEELGYIVYNSIGQLISTGDLNTTRSISVDELPAGLFHLQVFNRKEKIGNTSFIVID